MHFFLIAVIVVLGTLLLVITAFMEWVGIMNLLTRRTGPRYLDCGHLKAVPTSRHDRCWHCRHARLEHALHVYGH